MENVNNEQQRKPSFAINEESRQRMRHSMESAHAYVSAEAFSVNVTFDGFYGSRYKAEQVVKEIEESISDEIVVINLSNLVATSQSFVDELCKQILVIHKAKELVFVNASERFKKWVDLTSTIRDIESQIFFEEQSDD